MDHPEDHFLRPEDLPHAPATSSGVRESRCQRPGYILSGAGKSLPEAWEHLFGRGKVAARDAGRSSGRPNVPVRSEAGKSAPRRR